MEITEVTVRKISGKNDKIRGIASVVLDGCFKVKGIRIYEKEGNLTLAMPSRENRNTNRNDDSSNLTDKEARKSFDVAHPLDKKTRKMFEDAIFEEYEKVEENTEE